MKTEREKFEKFAKRKKYTLIAVTAEGKHEYLNQKTHTAWEAWQAAKTDAVPEGFILVPKEPNLEMIISGLAVVATEIGKHDMQEEIRMIWQKMIEAQEQRNG